PAFTFRSFSLVVLLTSALATGCLTPVPQYQEPGVDVDGSGGAGGSGGPPGRVSDGPTAPDVGSSGSPGPENMVRDGGSPPDASPGPQNTRDGGSLPDINPSACLVGQRVCTNHRT